jgi:hypothetical protein
MTEEIAERDAAIAWEIAEARAMVLAGNAAGLIAEHLDRALELLKTRPPAREPFAGKTVDAWLA